MVTENEPLVDNWYQDLDNGARFMVVAVDHDRDVVEIQHFDGDIEEIDLGNWYDMDLDLIEAPEDWSGPLDDYDREEADDSDDDDWDEDEDEDEDDLSDARGAWDEDEDEDEEEEEKPRRRRRSDWDED